MTQRKPTRNLLLRVEWENAPRAHREWAQHHVPSPCRSTGTVREDRPVLGLHRPTRWSLSPCDGAMPPRSQMVRFSEHCDGSEFGQPREAGGCCTGQGVVNIEPSADRAGRGTLGSRAKRPFSSCCLARPRSSWSPPRKAVSKTRGPGGFPRHLFFLCRPQQPRICTTPTPGSLQG